MDKYNIEFYTKQNGEQPAREFMLSLDSKMQAKIIRILDMLEVNGPLTGMPHSEYLVDGIFEIRAKQSNNINKWFCEEDTKNAQKRNNTSKEISC